MALDFIDIGTEEILNKNKEVAQEFIEDAQEIVEDDVPGAAEDLDECLEHIENGSWDEAHDSAISAFDQIPE